MLDTALDSLDVEPLSVSEDVVSLELVSDEVLWDPLLWVTENEVDEEVDEPPPAPSRLTYHWPLSFTVLTSSEASPRAVIGCASQVFRLSACPLTDPDRQTSTLPLTRTAA